jgi:hypothetical protein
LRVVARDPERAVVAADLPPLLGDYRVEADALVFRPRFPVAPGLSLEAYFAGERLGLPNLEERLLVVDTGTPQTVVEAVFPSGDEIPANLLRFYVHFSAPMALRDVPRRIKLLEADGRPIELPFVELEEGLWDPTHRRLTLIVHPGRIKRGVGPHEALGPVLVPGEEIRLVVEAEARDLDGRDLVQAFEKRYRVGPEERRALGPDDFRLEKPATGPAKLDIVATRPLDHALFERLIRVESEEGELVPGTVEIDEHERRWRFRPESLWRPGTYQVTLDAALEDLAGNRPGRSFEVEDGATSTPGPLFLEFDVE